MDTVMTRSRWIVGILVGALCICGVRLVQLQIIEGPSLAAQGQRVRTSSTEVAAARGTITDATGVVLANSIQTYDIAVNQVNIRSFVHRDDDGNEVGRGPAEAARLLAPILGMNEAELGGMLLGDSTYVYIKRNVDAVSYREIRKLDIYGIEWESVFEREYPQWQCCCARHRDGQRRRAGVFGHGGAVRHAADGYARRTGLRDRAQRCRDAGW